MDKIIVDYTKRINKKRLTLNKVKLLVEDWNYSIDMFGNYIISEALTWLELGHYAENAKYIDYKYGWTEPISIEKNFKVIVKGNNVWFETDLPIPKILD